MDPACSGYEVRLSAANGKHVRVLRREGPLGIDYELLQLLLGGREVPG